MDDTGEITATEDTKPLTQGYIIDTLFDLREENKGWEAQIKKNKEAAIELELQLIVLLDEQETTISGSKRAKVVLTEVEVPKVDEWDVFYAHILEHEAFHLLQRRPATTACRETIEAGDDIPGMSIFLKRSISLQKK
jgi:hypothetical protein